MMRSHDFAMLFKDARRELDENRELFCSLSEILIIFMPILPSALWNRTLVLLLYILLYNVNAQDKYYELKERFLAAPIMHYANAEARDASEADASEAESDASEAEASDEEADASEEEASDEEADASEADASEADDPNDSDYEEKKKETKKNK